MHSLLSDAEFLAYLFRGATIQLHHPYYFSLCLRKLFQGFIYSGEKVIIIHAV